MAGLETLALVRHGRTTYNAERRLSGDPAVPVRLDPVGRRQVEALRGRIGGRPIDLGVHTRFVRTVETLDMLLAGREVPRLECPLLDDVRLGRFEGATVEEYRDWRDGRGDDARPEGGESRVDALRRYAEGFTLLAAADAREVLVVTHDIPIRFLANALAGDDPLTGRVRAVANASLLLVGRADLEAAVGAMRGVAPDGGP